MFDMLIELFKQEVIPFLRCLYLVIKGAGRCLIELLKFCDRLLSLWNGEAFQKSLLVDSRVR